MTFISTALRRAFKPHTTSALHVLSVYIQQYWISCDSVCLFFITLPNQIWYWINFSYGPAKSVLILNYFRLDVLNQFYDVLLLHFYTDSVLINSNTNSIQQAFSPVWHLGHETKHVQLYWIHPDSGRVLHNSTDMVLIFYKESGTNHVYTNTLLLLL